MGFFLMESADAVEDREALEPNILARARFISGVKRSSFSAAVMAGRLLNSSALDMKRRAIRKIEAFTDNTHTTLGIKCRAVTK